MGSKTFNMLDNNVTKAWFDNFKKNSVFFNPTSENYYKAIGYVPMGEVSLSAPAQTTTETTPSDITNVDTATTNDSGMPNISSNADVQALVAQNNALNYANYVTAVNEGRKAYQELFKESLKRKQALADKKVRSDRSTALANALGSLVNVFTAYGMAKKGDYAPIVAEYDSTPDSELKKSIATRYALENENEGLLMQLVKDRVNSEAEIAKGKYERDVKANEAMAKAKAADNKNSLDWWKWQKGEEGRNKRNADSIAAADERARLNRLSRENAARIAVGKAIKEDERKLSPEEMSFAAAINEGVQDANETLNSVGITKSSSPRQHTLRDGEAMTYALIRRDLVARGFNPSKINKAKRIYNKIATQMPLGRAKMADTGLWDVVANNIGLGEDEVLKKVTEYIQQ